VSGGQCFARFAGPRDVGSVGPRDVGSAAPRGAGLRGASPRVAGLRLLYRVAFRLAQLRAVVLRRRGRGVKCLLIHDHREVLLVRHTYGPRAVWQLPGGGAHRGEAPASTAAREMEEELGLRDLSWHELVTFDISLEHMPVNLTCLYADVADPTLRPDPVEIAQARWFPFNHLPARLGDEVLQMLQMLPEGG
jgi:8-oxo-dGTP pyrophosphatase MutT (NUDIX family)